MKVRKTAPPESFQPVTLELTLESQSEVDRLYAIFNLSPLCRFIGDGVGCAVRAELTPTKPSAQLHDDLRDAVRDYYGA